MKKIILFFTFLVAAVALQAQIIRIPADYPTINEGIWAANPGDTVLVSPGTYTENINFSGKGITVASLFLTTQDTAYISQTQINGNLSGNPVVTFQEAEDSTAVLCGFTITNGRGGIYCFNSSPTLCNLTIKGNLNPLAGWWGSNGGGGMCCSGADPIVRNVTITNNTSLTDGGGVYCDNNSSPSLSKVTIAGNTASMNGGGIYCDNTSVPVFDSINRCNIYQNTAQAGSDLFSNALLHVIGDTFTVLIPGEFHTSPLVNFTFDILHGKSAQANADLYVSPAGNNNNSGLTASDPLKTIHQALSIILADTANPHTIHLLEGTYSPSASNEFFPIILPGFISLAGVADTAVILDADSTSGVIRVSDNFSSHISGVTITGGFASGENGGGVLCLNSDPVFENVVITGNYSQRTGDDWYGYSGGFGGGLSCVNSGPLLKNVKITRNTGCFGGGISSTDGSPVIENVIITNNTASSGGGIYLDGSSAVLEGVTITENTSGSQGGGIYIDGSSAALENVTVTYNTASYQGGGICFKDPGAVFDSINRCNIYFNTAPEGRELYSDTLVRVVADTFTVQHPTAYYAEPFSNFSFDILHGKIAQVDADLYVSPLGDNANSGLTPDEPLMNISYAFPFLRADSLHHHTIHLLDGSYSTWNNNETFPIIVPDYIDLAGTGQLSVYLYGDYSSAVLQFVENTSSRISGMTVSNGGNGGISCNLSNPVLDSIVLSNNRTQSAGGGLYCYQSSPVLQDVTIANNWATNSSFGYGGGIYCSYGSNPLLRHVTITNNAAVSGGGYYGEANTNPVMQNCVFSGNNASSSGGGCRFGFNSGGVLDSVRVTGNSAHTGGGIDFYASSEVSLKKVVISGNSADYGGGISTTIAEEPFLSNVTITNNTASLQGGGIHFNGTAAVFDTVTRCNIYLNDAPEGRDLFSAPSIISLVADTFTVLHPSSFYAEPIGTFTFDILHGKIEQADADIYVSPSGNNGSSGLTADKPLKTLQHAFSILRADAQHQHCIHLADGRYGPYTNGETFPLTIPEYMDLAGADDSTVFLDAEDKTQVLRFHYNRSSRVSGMTITGGYVADGSGGGILFDFSNPSLENMTITGNFAKWGGGISCGPYSNPQFQNIIISGNNASHSGGGIDCQPHSNPVFNDVSILDNSAPGGGGIRCTGKTIASFENATIAGNLAIHGGGIYIYDDPVLNLWPEIKIVNGTISKNHATRGGGIYCQNGVFTGTDVLIRDNTATWGGGFYLNGARPVLRNMTLSGNTADSVEGLGGGIFCHSEPKYTSATMVNSIIWNNLPQEIVLSPSQNFSKLTISYSDLKGGPGSIPITGLDTIIWLQGNLTSDPLFTGSGEYPLSLQAGSPCRNAGTTDTTGLYLPLTDLAGGPRICEERVDMGAYEWCNVGIEDQEVGSWQLAVSSYPNPFEESTTISYRLNKASLVEIRIYDGMGRLVDRPLHAFQAAGAHTLEWRAAGLPPGVYSVLLQRGDAVSVRKVIRVN